MVSKADERYDLSRPRAEGADLRRRVIEALNALHRRYRDIDDGRIADYIPELAKASPEWFGICIVTADGEVYEVGDAAQPFTIQSLSKPFVYGLALEDRGRETVLNKVGVEPSGDSFNSIIHLDVMNRPHNPMVNAGAIATTSLIKGNGQTDRLNRMLAMFGRYMGRPPSIDVSVFTSEKTTGHRNRAMGHLLLNFGIIEGEVESHLDLYFQQCSIIVTARDLATMAGTLANRGRNPMTGERAIESGYVRDLLTVMHTCGMYNYAGEWAYTVGLPAKSGVSGGLITVVPGQFGICVYSPLVDERGSSIRGLRVCEDLSRNCGMHIFEAWPRTGTLLERISGVITPAPSLPDAALHGPEAVSVPPEMESRPHRSSGDEDESESEDGFDAGSASGPEPDGEGR